MDPIRIAAGTALVPRCDECGSPFQVHVIDGTDDRLCLSCIGAYADLGTVLTLGEIVARLEGAAITESELRAQWGDR